MKVFYNGFNLHRQFPSETNLVENFIDFQCERLLNIEVSYHYCVLLVADTLIVKGAKNFKFQISDQIQQICCNDNNILLLSTNGDLFKINETITKVPKLLNLDDDDHIIDIAGGSKITTALTKHGYLYSVPNKLNYRNREIIAMKNGKEHCLLLDKSGNVWSFGRGSRGQLGHGTLDDESEPKLIDALCGIQIVAISAGGWHSCALSKDGDLYVWGWNSNGQLGLSENENSKSENCVAVLGTPHVVNLNFNVIQVDCGGRHTVVLSDDGKLYGCGWNKYKQLKNDPMIEFYKMIFLKDFDGEDIKYIKCGPWNTIILCNID